MLSLVWYTGIVLNFPLLHSYWCLATFNFLFSGILMLLLCSDILVMRTCFDLCTLLNICQIRLCRQHFFLSWNLNLYLLSIFSGFFKVLGFDSINYTSFSTSFILTFRYSLCCEFSLNVEEVSILKRFLSCLWLLITFVVSSISLIFSSFLSSWFFIIFMNSSMLFLL